MKCGTENDVGRLSRRQSFQPVQIVRMVCTPVAYLDIAENPINDNAKLKFQNRQRSGGLLMTDKLQRVINAAARIISNTQKFDHGLIDAAST